jgi:hypothetical protein
MVSGAECQSTVASKSVKLESEREKKRRGKIWREPDIYTPQRITCSSLNFVVERREICIEQNHGWISTEPWMDKYRTMDG